MSGTPAWCCPAHLGQVPYPRYNSWVLAFADLKGSEIAPDLLLSVRAWSLFLAEGTDCSEPEQCEGEHRAELSSLGMDVVQFCWLHAELRAGCGPSSLLLSLFSVLTGNLAR